MESDKISAIKSKATNIIIHEHDATFGHMLSSDFLNMFPNFIVATVG